MALSTWIVAPTSTSRAESFLRPEVEVGGTTTRVMLEHMRAVDPEVRLGDVAGACRSRRWSRWTRRCARCSGWTDPGCSDGPARRAAPLPCCEGLGCGRKIEESRCSVDPIPQTAWQLITSDRDRIGPPSSHPSGRQGRLLRQPGPDRGEHRGRGTANDGRRAAGRALRRRLHRLCARPVVRVAGPECLRGHDLTIPDHDWTPRTRRASSRSTAGGVTPAKDWASHHWGCTSQRLALPW